jgi:hypothetical protein
MMGENILYTFWLTQPPSTSRHHIYHQHWSEICLFWACYKSTRVNYISEQEGENEKEKEISIGQQLLQNVIHSCRKEIGSLVAY